MSPLARRSTKPSLRVERALQRDGYAVLAGMDEVGRGALAGPVSVGVVVIDAGSRTAPMGVKDSKLLTPAARSALVPRIQRWGRAYAVGHSWPSEIDAMGIIAALRLAGRPQRRHTAAVTPDHQLASEIDRHRWPPLVSCWGQRAAGAMLKPPPSGQPVIAQSAPKSWGRTVIAAFPSRCSHQGKGTKPEASVTHTRAQNTREPRQWAGTTRPL